MSSALAAKIEKSRNGKKRITHQIASALSCRFQCNHGSQTHLPFSLGVVEIVAAGAEAAPVVGVVVLVVNKSLTNTLTPPPHPAGVHHGRVLSSDVDRRAAKIRGPHRDPAAQQPDGQQDLDSGHLFPEWQEVDLSQHDHPQQAVSHHAERNYPLHHEV